MGIDPSCAVPAGDAHEGGLQEGFKKLRKDRKNVDLEHVGLFPALVAGSDGLEEPGKIYDNDSSYLEIDLLHQLHRCRDEAPHTFLIFDQEHIVSPSFPDLANATDLLTALRLHLASD
jgi:hypothetical protein